MVQDLLSSLASTLHHLMMLVLEVRASRAPSLIDHLRDQAQPIFLPPLWSVLERTLPQSCQLQSCSLSLEELSFSCLLKISLRMGELLVFLLQLLPFSRLLAPASCSQVYPVGHGLA